MRLRCAHLLLALAAAGAVQASPYVAIPASRLDGKLKVDLNPYDCRECVEVINGTDEAVANVAVAYSFTDFGDPHYVHVPYIPARHAARVYIGRGTYFRTIYVSSRAHGSSFDADAVRRLLRAKRDFQIESDGFAPGPGEALGPRQLLDLVKGKPALDMVTGVLLETRSWREALIAYVTRVPKAEQVLSLARQLGATSETSRSLALQALDHPESLKSADLAASLAPLLRQQCNPRAPGAVQQSNALWEVAGRRFGAAKAVSLLNEVCPASSAALVALLERSPREGRPALLDGLPLKTFLSMCKTSQDVLLDVLTLTKDAGKLQAIVEGQCVPLDPDAKARALLDGSALLVLERRELFRGWMKKADGATELALATALIKGTGHDETSAAEAASYVNWSRPEVLELLRAELQAGPALGRGAAGATAESPQAAYALLRCSRRLAQDCGANPPDVVACSKHLDQHLDLARFGLTPALIETIEARVAGQVEKLAEPDFAQAVAHLEPWGVSRADAIRLACDDPNRPLSTLDAIDEDHLCQSRRAFQGFRASVAYAAQWALVAAIGVFPFFFLRRLLRKKWAALAPLLREGPPKEPPSYADRLEKGWARTVEMCLARARSNISSSGVPGAAAAVSALENVAALQHDLAGLTVSTAADALSSGEVQSCLLRTAEDAAVYVLVFPSEHSDGRGVRRHEAFAAGWEAHVDAVRSRIRSGELPPTVLLAFFLHPEARRGSMVAGYDDGHVRVTPAGVLEARAQREHAGRLVVDRAHFDIAAEG